MTEPKSNSATTPVAESPVATKALATLQDAASLVQKYAHNIAGKEAAAQFATHISVMAQRDLKFKQATPTSIVTAMMACVHLGLMPNTPEQFAYLIPYNNHGKMEVQFQLGYKGLVELAYRSSQIRSMNAELVFDGDDFDWELGLERKLKHRPGADVDRTDYSKVIAAYVTVMLTSGDVVFDVMTRPELDKIQKSAKASSTDAPWAKWPEAMAKKTVVKRALKLLPSSSEDYRLNFAAAVDSWAEAGKLSMDARGEIIEGELEKDDAKSKHLANIAAATAKQAELKAKEFTPTAEPSNIDEETGEVLDA